MINGFDGLVSDMDDGLIDQFGAPVVFHFETGDESINVLIEEGSKEYGNKRHSHINQSEQMAEVSAVHFERIDSGTTLTIGNKLYEVSEKKPIVKNTFFFSYVLPTNGGEHRWN